MLGNYAYRIYDERKHFPLTGMSWVVEKVKRPTMRTGSVHTIMFRGKNIKECVKYCKTRLKQFKGLSDYKIMKLALKN